MSSPEARLLQEALAGATRLAERLRASTERIALLRPIDAAKLDSLTFDEDERLAAFLKRFEQLVVVMQDQAFKGLAIWLGTKSRLESRRDYAELMEQVGAVARADTWRDINLLRNRLAHVYPTAPDRQAAIVNEALTLAPELIADVERLRDTARRLGIIGDES